MDRHSQGLFQRWLKLEKETGRSMTDILADLNAVAHTRYTHNWPSVIAKRDFQMERCPVEVRRYMMTKVLKDEFARLDIKLTDAKLAKLVFGLT